MSENELNDVVCHHSNIKALQATVHHLVPTVFEPSIKNQVPVDR